MYKLKYMPPCYISYDVPQHTFTQVCICNTCDSLQHKQVTLGKPQRLHNGKALRSKLWLNIEPLLLQQVFTFTFNGIQFAENRFMTEETGTKQTCTPLTLAVQDRETLKDTIKCAAMMDGDECCFIALASFCFFYCFNNSFNIA